ncbi:hypothetical protein BVH03_18535 [Pseudomonas sp. PA15(2017)]|uniref:DUF2946 family protein n=1 Tax=Pseudomonas sp. PA15(2017) TaxID=1932111 RepID=UPI000965EE55|nr:DUF2946 family protein [Pseudomonas sp. PA15(2017)]OLU25629.1 hypothetical protein BVH03_18535 [Pseudomonas sp. PA15(2017)]
MKIARRDRSLIAWMLYASILFALLACAIHHGQGAGLQLSGLDGGFCSLHGDASSADGVVPADAMMNTFQCPLCSAMVMGLALLFALAWLPRAKRVLRLWREPLGKLPPRYLWPSANPRASPQLLTA